MSAYVGSSRDLKDMKDKRTALSGPLLIHVEWSVLNLQKQLREVHCTTPLYLWYICMFVCLNFELPLYNQGTRSTRPVCSP